MLAGVWLKKKKKKKVINGCDLLCCTDDQLKIYSRFVCIIHDSKEALIAQTNFHKLLGQIVFEVRIVDCAELRIDHDLFAVTKLRAEHVLNQVVDSGTLWVNSDPASGNRANWTVRVGWFKGIRVDRTSTGAF